MTGFRHELKGKRTRTLRRIARIWSLVIMAITLFIIIVNLFVPDPYQSPDIPWTEYLLASIP